MIAVSVTCKNSNVRRGPRAGAHHGVSPKQLSNRNNSSFILILRTCVPNVLTEKREEREEEGTAGRGEGGKGREGKKRERRKQNRTGCSGLFSRNHRLTSLGGGATSNNSFSVRVLFDVLCLSAPSASSAPQEALSYVSPGDIGLLASAGVDSGIRGL